MILAPQYHREHPTTGEPFLLCHSSMPNRRPGSVSSHDYPRYATGSPPPKLSAFSSPSSDTSAESRDGMQPRRRSYKSCNHETHGHSSEPQELESGQWNHEIRRGPHSRCHQVCTPPPHRLLRSPYWDNDDIHGLHLHYRTHRHAHGRCFLARAERLCDHGPSPTRHHSCADDTHFCDFLSHMSARTARQVRAILPHKRRLDLSLVHPCCHSYGSGGFNTSYCSMACADGRMHYE